MPLKYGNFSAWIEVDGAELPIFDAKEKDKEASGWIPSETGKNFVVHWSSGTTSSFMVGDVYIDGTSVIGRTMPAGPPKTSTAAGLLTSVTSERPFAFAPLELTDDDQYLHGTPSGLGEISVKIANAIHVGQTAFTLPNHNPIGKVHERSKKATSQVVSLGQAKPIPTQTMTSVKRLDPVVTFVFKYRHIDMLRANGLAPPEPSSNKRAAPLDEPEVLDLTEEQAGSDDEEERRIKALRDELATLERKRRKTSHVKAEPGVKQEPGSSSGRRDGRNGVASLGVVDLT